MFRADPQISDVDAVEHLVRQTKVFNQSEIAIARELVEESLAKGAQVSGYHFLFADGPKGVEGFTCFGPIAGTNARWELYWIAVDPTARRSGLGTRLQIASEKAMRAMGAAMMIAETSTRPDYGPARQFYLAQGYTLAAEVADWHDDGDGLAIYAKRF